jgi:hypothetical protein
VKSVRRFTMVVLLVSSACLMSAEESQGAQEREYPHSIAAVKIALQKLGAYAGSRLPTLDGFIKTDRRQLDQYERPYYEFKLDLVPAASDRTLVRVKANVSAWYTDPQGARSGYQAFESNGRLENDLLDRLNEFLTKNKSTLLADPDTLAKQIAAIRQQRLEAERRISELEKHLQELQDPKAETRASEYVSVSQPQVPLLSAPQNIASVLLRAQMEDEFEVLERRGAWLRVGLEDARSGWIKRSQVQVNTLASNATEQGKTSSSTEGFTIIREMSSDFSGDWIRLKGKKVLYIWARPESSALNVMPAKKLQFAESLFLQRYREISHSSQNSVKGIVVIFLDQSGGVAATSLDDVRLWADGTLSQAAFRQKCSLDPRSAFATASH